VTAGENILRAPIIVDAAGAWGDRIAVLAGRRPVGLQPKRRSMAVVPLPDHADVMNWPLVGDVGETWYCKPQSGKLIVSPADATPVDPHDAYADDMTLAEGIDRFQQAVDYEVTRVERTWGGLRSFVPDGNPVVGYDKHAGRLLLAHRPGRLRDPVVSALCHASRRRWCVERSRRPTSWTRGWCWARSRPCGSSP
jgi:D-arginine dehydrogenase